jgi:hypothetical protein
LSRKVRNKYIENSLDIFTVVSNSGDSVWTACFFQTLCQANVDSHDPSLLNLG